MRERLVSLTAKCFGLYFLINDVQGEAVRGLLPLIQCYKKQKISLNNVILNINFVFEIRNLFLNFLTFSLIWDSKFYILKIQL